MDSEEHGRMQRIDIHNVIWLLHKTLPKVWTDESCLCCGKYFVWKPPLWCINSLWFLILRFNQAATAVSSIRYSSRSPFPWTERQLFLSWKTDRLRLAKMCLGFELSDLCYCLGALKMQQPTRHKWIKPSVSSDWGNLNYEGEAFKKIQKIGAFLQAGNVPFSQVGCPSVRRTVVLLLGLKRLKTTHWGKIWVPPVSAICQKIQPWSRLHWDRLIRQLNDNMIDQWNAKGEASPFWDDIW